MSYIVYNIVLSQCLNLQFVPTFSGDDYCADTQSLFSYISLNIASALIILICISIIIYQYWVIQKKNRKLAEYILKIYGGISDINSEIKLHNSSSSVSQIKKSVTNENNQTLNRRIDNSIDEKELFDRFDKIVHFDKLYLNYNLGRDDYLRIMGVDKNRFGSIIKEYSGGNLSTYLNNLRLEHSVQLLRSDKNTTVNEIASQCAFPNVATFYRLFKEKYGVSPQKFRKE